MADRVITLQKERKLETYFPSGFIRLEGLFQIMFGKFIEKYYPDGTLYFEGLSRDGIPNGYGKSYFKNGSIQYEGTWANGKYHGSGTLYDEDGREIYTGEWFNGHQLKTDSPKDYKNTETSKELRNILMK